MLLSSKISISQLENQKSEDDYPQQTFQNSGEEKKDIRKVFALIISRYAYIATKPHTVFKTSSSISHFSSSPKNIMSSTNTQR